MHPCAASKHEEGKFVETATQSTLTNKHQTIKFINHKTKNEERGQRYSQQELPTYRLPTNQRDASGISAEQLSSHVHNHMRKDC